jgi:hypothetical protein
MATKPGLYANIHAKRERIEAQKASGEEGRADAHPWNQGRTNGQGVCRVCEDCEEVMPLIKDIGKEAFAKNVKAEIAAGKAPKQAVAIAYSVKREAAKKKKGHNALREIAR